MFHGHAETLSIGGQPVLCSSSGSVEARERPCFEFKQNTLTPEVGSQLFLVQVVVLRVAATKEQGSRAKLAAWAREGEGFVRVWCFNAGLFRDE